jgi:DNA-binding transcriptional regulator PaaX
MNVTSEAPTLTSTGGKRRYPVGGRIGPAWQEAWEYLRQHAGGWTDGRELAKDLADKHGLSEDTLVALFTRMATAGHLQRVHFNVKTKRGPRKRTHYKIKV